MAPGSSPTWEQGTYQEQDGSDKQEGVKALLGGAWPGNEKKTPESVGLG